MSPTGSHRGRMILAMVLTYMVFAVLLNSVGTVILQAIQGFGDDGFPAIEEMFHGVRPVVYATVVRFAVFIRGAGRWHRNRADRAASG